MRTIPKEVGSCTPAVGAGPARIRAGLSLTRGLAREEGAFRCLFRLDILTKSRAAELITLFACPKPFLNKHIATIQRNAITSWTRLRSKPQITLMGDEEGVEEFAGALRVGHQPDIARNKFGTPLLSEVFELAEKGATSDVMCYVNADILLFDDFVDAIARISEWRNSSLTIGGRLELDFGEAIDFDQDGWDVALKAMAWKEGHLSSAGMDYFVYPKGLYRDIPPLAIGRPAFDNWLVWSARSRGVPVVDATNEVMAVHQNHRARREWERLLRSPESDENRRLCSPWQQSFTIQDATHELAKDGVRARRALALVRRVGVIVNMMQRKSKSIARAALRRVKS